MQRVRNRWTARAALVLGIGLALAPAATWAHPIFRDTPFVPRDRDARLVLHVPRERGPDVHNTRIAVAVPQGFTLAGCERTAEFTCTTSGGSGDASAVVVWSRQSGSSPDADFAFTVHTPAKAGRYGFKVNQSYDDGTTVRWDGPPGSDFPAAVLQVS